MKTPKVIFKKNVFFEINTIDPTLITNDHIRKEIYEAVQLAEEMAVIAVQTIEYIYRGTSEEDIKKRWNKSRDVVKYFGSNLEVQQIKIVRKRMRRIHRWLHKRKLTIRLLSQNKASSHTMVGCNYGSVLSPRRFVLYPNWFKQHKNYKASEYVLKFNSEILIK